MLPGLEKLLVAAVDEAVRAGSNAIEPLHVLLAAMIDDSAPETRKIVEALRELARRPVADQLEVPQRVSSRVVQALATARREARRARREIEITDVIRALAGQGHFRRVGGQLGEPFLRLVARLGAGEPEGAGVGRAPESRPVAAPYAHPLTPILDKHGTDLTVAARQGRLEPLIGRSAELKQIVRTLLRSQKSNPLLIGEAGVGKTSIVEGLALAVVQPDAPDEIRSKRIVEVSISALASHAKYRGALEQILGQIMTECAADPELVLFIDEIHLLAEAHATALAVVKPALARGEVKLIGATTPKDYRKSIEPDDALARRFLPIHVEEPDPSEAVGILRGLRATLELHHGVLILDPAIDAAVRLAVRYLPDRRLPDKARDLIDQAAAARRFLTLTPRVPASADSPAEIDDEIKYLMAAWVGNVESGNG